MALYFKEKSDSLLVIERDAKQTSQILTLQRKYERGKLLLDCLLYTSQPGGGEIR